MIPWLKKYYYQLQIRLLAIFRTSVLFDRINQLDWYKNTLHQWIDDQNLTPKNKVLEVGCATGALTAYIAQLDCNPTGVDSSDKMIKLAQMKNDGIDFLVADTLALPFDTDSFDVVIAASLINIIPDKSKAISELTRTCKKGGRITILVPSTDFTDKDLLSLHASLGNTDFSFAALEAWHKIPSKMETKDIISLFNQAGLTNITTKHYLHGMVIAVSAIKLL